MTGKNLGRGLAAFLDVEAKQTDVLQLPIENIHPNPSQPRRVFDEEQLQNLTDSVRRTGILQPIITVKQGKDSYQLVAGERRLRAAEKAGLTHIPAIVRELTDEEQLEVALLENIQRENLSPIEEAEAYKRLRDEFNHTQEELAGILGKSRSHIANMLRLLTLPRKVQQMLGEGKISFGHARALIGLPNAEQVAEQIEKKALNVRQTEQFAKKKKSALTPSGIDPDLQNIMQQLSALLGLQASIKLRGQGGVISIDFTDLQELDSLLKRLSQ